MRLGLVMLDFMDRLRILSLVLNDTKIMRSQADTCFPQLSQPCRNSDVCVLCPAKYLASAVDNTCLESCSSVYLWCRLFMSLHVLPSVPCLTNSLLSYATSQYSRPTVFVIDTCMLLEKH